MALALAFDAAKKDQRKHGCHTHFFGSRKEPDLPLASLNQHNQGYFTGTHFHTADQFQVVVQGEGTLGRHALAPYTVHFTRAYTPYGPLTSNTQDGITFFVMRTHAETGAQFIPEQIEQLRQVPDRQPWQASSRVTIPAVQSGADVLLQAVPDIKDDYGLAVYTLNMKPQTEAQAPDPSHGDGQYLVVVKGSVLYQNKEHKAPALVFVYAKEGPFELHAGAEGLEALVLNFPRPQTRAATHAQATPGFKTWQCALCEFTYNEAAGLPEEGIAPGTRWQDVPDSWSCPDCSASKSDFQMVEL